MSIEQIENIISIFRSKVKSDNQLYEHKGKIEDTEILTLKIFDSENGFASLQFWKYPTVDDFYISLFVGNNQCTCSDFKIAEILLTQI